MKTSRYLQALAQYGWEIARSSKHVQFTNRFFRAERPVALQHSKMRQIDPECAENTAKLMGLIWELDGSVRPNPKHRYYGYYQAMGLTSLAA